MSMPESEILAVALTRYADACPPTLHPDCPFAVTGAAGRTCHQECRDEVVRLQRPAHTGISAFSSMLFDAGQTLLSEDGLVPNAGWHTTSLVLRLEQALNHPPIGPDGEYLLRRDIDATNSMAYLGQRGIDPEWLVRFGLGPLLTFRIVVWVGSHYLNREDGPDPTGGWLAAAESFVGVGAEFDGLGPWLAKAHQSGFREHVDRWVKQAPFEDLWMWRPAPVDQDLTVADDGQAAWVMDRFRLTYLSDWAEASLHHEYRYQRGDDESPIPAMEMKRRDVPFTNLTAEIAARAVGDKGRHSADVTWQALQFLEEGRRREAAALFDATRIIDPADANAHNNYGFCITPDEPSEALMALRRAAELEGVDDVNRINQAVALRLLNRLDDALAAAERAYAHRASLGISAWLWERPDDPDQAKVINVDPASYLIDLGFAIAKQMDDAESQALWHSRSTDGSGLE